MRIANTFLVILIIKSAEQQCHELNNYIKTKTTKKQFMKYDLGKKYEIDYLKYDNDKLLIHKNNKSIYKIKSYDFVKAFEEVQKILLNNETSIKSPKILVYAKNANNSTGYNNIIIGIKNYNTKDDKWNYDMVIEENSGIYNYIFSYKFDDEISCIKNDYIPFLYTFINSVDGIYYFYEIDITEIDLQKLFEVHVERYCTGDKYQKVILLQMLKLFDFVTLSEVYDITKFQNYKVTSEVEKLIDEQDENYTFFEINNQYGSIICKHEENAKIFCYRKNLYKNEKNNQEIFISRPKFAKMKRIVMLMNTKQIKNSEINLIYKLIENNDLTIRILKSIFLNKTSAVHFLFEELLKSSDLLSKMGLKVLTKSTNAFENYIMIVTGQKKQFMEDGTAFIKYLNNEHNNTSYMIKICLIMELEKIIGENNENKTKLCRILQISQTL
ncbi:uncharacterized protein VNE69_06013 [Vairimorpha necatrix]|uniref:Uncharacterized protein n=1 Tax=Vairimorpha necatrix TaxID=6039 RepID=A0AAX4JCL8_9MICR